MVKPFRDSPFGGNLGVRNAVIYRLNRVGNSPVATIAELANPFSANKVGLDVVDSEAFSRAYTVTTNPLQDFTSATSNVHKDLMRITLSGTLISSIDVPFIGSIGVPGIPGGFGGGLRADLLKIRTLEAIADERRPVMIVSPRVSLARAFIESVDTNWSPDVGENTQVSISFVEARIVSPLLAENVPQDVGALANGNADVSSLGGQAPKSIGATASSSNVPGLPPFVQGVV